MRIKDVQEKDLAVADLTAKHAKRQSRTRKREWRVYFAYI